MVASTAARGSSGRNSHWSAGALTTNCKYSLKHSSALSSGAAAAKTSPQCAHNSRPISDAVVKTVPPAGWSAVARTRRRRSRTSSRRRSMFLRRPSRWASGTLLRSSAQSSAASARSTNSRCNATARPRSSPPGSKQRPASGTTSSKNRARRGSPALSAATARTTASACARGPPRRTVAGSERAHCAVRRNSSTYMSSRMPGSAMAARSAEFSSNRCQKCGTAKMCGGAGLAADNLRLLVRTTAATGKWSLGRLASERLPTTAALQVSSDASMWLTSA